MSDNVIDLTAVIAKRKAEEDALLLGIPENLSDDELFDLAQHSNLPSSKGDIDVTLLNSKLVAQAITRMIVDHLFDCWELDVEQNPNTIYELTAIMGGIAQLLDRMTDNTDERHEQIMIDLEDYIGSDPKTRLQALLYPTLLDEEDD